MRFLMHLCYYFITYSRAFMEKKINYYDLFAVFIPGTVSILMFLLITNKLDKDSLDIILKISIGSAIFTLVAIYIFGEMVQSLGKIAQKLFWLPFGGMPTVWIAKRKTNKPWNKIVFFLRSGNSSLEHEVVSEHQRMQIQFWMNQCNLEMNIFTLKSAFSSMQTIAFRANKEWITIMLAKANMFRGFIVLALLGIISDLTYNQSWRWETQIPLITFWAISSWRYVTFSRNYAKKFYSSFTDELSRTSISPSHPLPLPKGV